jgi:hypothetical protein
MKQILIFFLVQLLVSFVSSFFLNDGIDDYDFLTVFGFMNFIIAFLGLVVAVLMKVFNNESASTIKSLLAASGILLLVGFGICSQFPLRINLPE